MHAGTPEALRGLGLYSVAFGVAAAAAEQCFELSILLHQALDLKAQVGYVLLIPGPFVLTEALLVIYRDDTSTDEAARFEVAEGVDVRFKDLGDKRQQLPGISAVLYAANCALIATNAQAEIFFAVSEEATDAGDVVAEPFEFSV